MKRTVLMAGIGLLCSSVAFAGDIKMRGFASMVAGQALGNGDSLYGYDTEFDMKNDSLAALQFDADLEDGLSATVQFIARGSDSYDPKVEWAYLTYEFNEAFQLSAGRIRMPFYRYSDYLDVRYAYTWVKAPDTVYGFEFPGYDGISLLHNASIGEFDSTVQVGLGKFEGTLSGTIEASFKDLVALNWTLTRDWLTLRAGYFRSRATFDLDPAVTQLAGLATQLGLDQVASGILPENDVGDFFGLAVGIDHNNIVIDIEMNEYQVEDSLFAKTEAFFVMFGYRFGEWMPYVTYSELESKPSSDSLAILSDIPADFTNILDTTNPFNLLYLGTSGAFASTNEERTLQNIGVRYDFHSSAALKLEIASEENLAGDKSDLARVGIDLVF